MLELNDMALIRTIANTCARASLLVATLPPRELARTSRENTVIALAGKIAMSSIRGQRMQQRFVQLSDGLCCPAPPQCPPPHLPLGKGATLDPNTADDVAAKRRAEWDELVNSFVIVRAASRHRVRWLREGEFKRRCSSAGPNAGATEGGGRLHCPFCAIMQYCQQFSERGNYYHTLAVDIAVAVRPVLASQRRHLCS